MKRFDDLFTPLASPDRKIEPHEHVLNQIRSLDGERHDARAWLFMNQLNDAEAGNIGNIVPEQGNVSAIGGEPLPPPPPAVVPPVRPDPANVNIVNEYNSFNLANVTPPIAPKWKMSETLLDDFHKFKQSCQCIFDGPMCHITSGKVKTSMLLIWAGPDGEDIYENFNLLPHQKYDVDYVLRRFEECCEPICNFRMARFKFSKVYQHNGESVDIFYNRILKTARQCEFPDRDDHIIGAIIFRTNCVKVQDKLLQTPKTLSLQQCLSVVQHYELLKLHIQQIRPDKNINYLRQCHSGKKKGQRTQSNAGQSNQNQRGCSQPCSRQGQNQIQQKSTLLHRNQCFGCGQDHHQDKSKCPAFGKTCHKCGRSNHLWQDSLQEIIQI